MSEAESNKRQIKNTKITNGMTFKSICKSESLITDNCHLAIIGYKNSGKSTFI
jgi:GTPase SAR1 family protein